jgi:hypothetical protein
MMCIVVHLYVTEHGLRCWSDCYIWYLRKPSSIDNSSHILNTFMRRSASTCAHAQAKFKSVAEGHPLKTRVNQHPLPTGSNFVNARHAIPRNSNHTVAPTPQYTYTTPDITTLHILTRDSQRHGTHFQGLTTCVARGIVLNPDVSSPRGNCAIAAGSGVMLPMEKAEHAMRRTVVCAARSDMHRAMREIRGRRRLVRHGGDVGYGMMGEGM